jgi:hypothetical protein
MLRYAVIEGGSAERGKRRREVLLWFLGPCCGLCKANYPSGYTTQNRRSDGFAAAAMVNPVTA